MKIPSDLMSTATASVSIRPVNKEGYLHLTLIGYAANGDTVQLWQGTVTNGHFLYFHQKWNEAHR